MRIFFLTLLFGFYTAKSQDSTKTKLLNHEIGFNTVSLVKQMLSNTPTNTLAQLPYDFYYNIYYKDLVGLRFGAGVSSNSTKTQVDGQQYPRETVSSAYLVRTGASYNFVNNKKLAFNCFADFSFGTNALYTTNTSTSQTFPNPLQTITTETSDVTKSKIFQAGVGVKYNFTRNLSVYTEVPYAFIKEKTSSDVSINDTGEITKSQDNTSVFRTKIYLPTTVYLVLRF